MSSNLCYQVLVNQEDDHDGINQNGAHDVPAGAVSSDPPPVEEAEGHVEPIAIHHGQSPPPYVAEGSTSVAEPSNDPPPQYTDVVKLPTYNESENLEENEPDEPNEHGRSFFFWFNNDTLNHHNDSRYDVGSDASFMFSFLLALIFNWIGFLVSYCFTRSLASYYGAISGFGISLVKWAFIAQHSNWSREFMVENPWFCYAFVLFGWVIFMRGIFAYIQMKRLANRNYSGDENRCGLFS